jgi:hypothetical protein
MGRRLALVAALVALPLSAAACGGSNKAATTVTTTSSTSAMDAVKSAAEKTVKAGSMQMTLSASTATGGTKVVATGNGAFDTPNHQGELHLKFAAGPVASTIDVVVDGTDLYLKSPLFSVVLPTGKSWIKVNVEKGVKAGGIDLSSLLAQDPSKALGELQTLASVTTVGTVQIGGMTATHYRARTVKGAAGTAAGGTYDVWVGDDGYIHRVRTVVAAASGSSAATITATSNLSGFGEPVTVTVPPASQTVTSNTGSIPGLGG